MKEKLFRELLERGLDEVGLEISIRQREMLLQHYLLLEKWSVVHNLTAIGSVKDAVFSHYIDCLKGLSFLSPSFEVCDFGSGAGFPGVVAAILWPDISIRLVEASRKKCSFLRVAIAELALRHAAVEQARIERVRGVSFAISRATFSFGFLHTAAQALSFGGHLALWIGEEDASFSEKIAKSSLVRKEEYSYRWQGIGMRKVVLLEKIG